MDWQRHDFDWNHVRAFLATAEHGSFSAAAKILGTTQPTVGRQVTELESQLKVTLFERIGRGLSLTPTGLELVEHVRVMSDAALRISRIAAGQALSLDGPICISASELVAAYLLPKRIAKLHAKYPGIDIEVVASNTPQDLQRREADIALRNFRPTEPELVAKKIRDFEAHFYATHNYLKELGTGTASEIMSRTKLNGFDHSDTFCTGINKALGLALTPSQFRFVSKNQHVQWALAQQGLGAAMMLSEIGDTTPTVKRVHPDLPPLPVPLWLVTHRDIATSHRVRVVADFLVEDLRT